jgi:hypothetical protein
MLESDWQCIHHIHPPGYGNPSVIQAFEQGAIRSTIPSLRLPQRTYQIMLDEVL